MNRRVITPRSSNPAWQANSGAWRSRTRREPVRSSLLGQDDGVIYCPRRISLGLKFEDTHPVSCMQEVLQRAGFRDFSELREAFPMPQDCLIARRREEPATRVPVAQASPLQVLEQALWLGLCTEQLFDPKRPVLWTETSLTRVLELFDPRGYYA